MSTCPVPASLTAADAAPQPNDQGNSHIYLWTGAELTTGIDLSTLKATSISIEVVTSAVTLDDGVGGPMNLTLGGTYNFSNDKGTVTGADGGSLFLTGTGSALVTWQD